MSPAADADLQIVSSRVHRGGGNVWIVEYDATKDPYQPHASLDTAAIATATTLSCYRAVASGDLHVLNQFGSSGTLDIDIFAQDAAAENKAFSALATNDFTITALTTGRSVGAVVKLLDAADYTITDWKNIGHLGGTTLRDATPTEHTFNEKREKVAAHDGDRDIGLVTVMLQSTKFELDFLTKEARGLFYALKYVVDYGALGKQIVVAKYAKIVSNIEAPFASDRDTQLSVTFEVLKDGTSDEYQIYLG